MVRCCFLLLLALAAPARAAKEPAVQSLRQLSGNVGSIDRAGEPLPRYLDRLEAALWLEQARATAGPYVVSIANSLEALDPKERAGRGDRLLLHAYLLLSGFAGPQAGRLMHLYAVGLGQLVGAKPEEVTIPEALRRDLRQMGSYAAAAASRLIDRLPPPERAEPRVLWLLQQGRYAAAAQQARAWEQAAPSAIGRAYTLGSQLLSGQPTAPALRQLEREGGPGGQLAWQLLRRAAREALVARLGRSLTAPAAPAEVRKAAAAWGKPDEPPLRDGCQLLLKQEAAHPALPDCLVLLLESPGSEWAGHPALERAAGAGSGAAAPGSPGSDPGKEPAPGTRRLLLLRLASQLGVLLGLPGQRPSADAAVRAKALDEATRLLPQAGLPPEEADALMLLAQIGAAQRPEIPAHLHPAIDKFLRAYPCSPLSVPLYLGRHTQPGPRTAALAEALGRCDAADTRAADAQRQLALQLIALAPTGAAAEAAWQALERLAAQARKRADGGRFLLAAADGAALRLLRAQGGAADDGALGALQRRYEEAAAALAPLDGAEARGRAALQIAALLYRRHQLKANPELLEAARGQLRYALLLPAGEEVLLAQAIEEGVVREGLLLRQEVVPPPTADLSKLPASLGRRVLACELAQQARAAAGAEAARGPPTASDAAARYQALVGTGPLPGVTSYGQVRLTTSLGIDERLRVGTRGELGVVVLPRCSVR